MVRLRRRADFKATLVYVDEPQVVHLLSGKVPIIAVAIPSAVADEAKFLATTASQEDWDSYLEGASDLRFLFTYPRARLLYTFDLTKLNNGKVTMEPLDGDVPEEFLPPTQFFSSSHTEVFEPIPQPSEVEQLLVAGEWQLQEFGHFYQRYADIYAFVVSQLNWRDGHVAQSTKTKIAQAFGDRPFKGGSSYLHLYDDLFYGLRRSERIGLDKVQYASPGYVDINGRADAFEQVNTSVQTFLEHHINVTKAYVEFRAYLSKGGYLQMSGSEFLESDPHAGHIRTTAQTLALQMPPLDFATICELSHNNSLVAAKVVLSFYRRLNDAASFFAQGRVAFE